jgi:hypothetical protein
MMLVKRFMSVFPMDQTTIVLDPRMKGMVLDVIHAALVHPLGA